MCSEAPKDYEDTHYHYLEQEHKRLEKIRTDKEDRLKKLAEERAQRRHRRQLLRVERSKRKLKEEIENKVVSRRTNEPDIWSIKLLSFSDDDNEPKKFRTYGGFLYELWAVTSNVRTSLNKRVETPFEKFLLDDDQKKFMIHLLSENSIKDRGIRISFNEKYKTEIEEALNHMENDLFSFNETKEQVISNITEHDDLLVGLGLEFALQHTLFEKDVLKAILKGLLRIFFKSNSYKLPEEPKVIGDAGADASGGASGDLKPPGEDQKGVSDPSGVTPTDGAAAGEPQPHDDPTQTAAHTAPKRVIPEISEEDKKVEALKRKLEVVFRAPELPQQAGNYSCVFRLRESLNRTAIRPEVRQRLEEEEQRQKEEASKVVDPKAELKYHGKQYLLDEYLGQLRQLEEARKQEAEEAARREEEAYIEQFHGDTYARDWTRHEFEEADRPPTALNESLWSSSARVLFLHRVDQGLFRRELVAKLRELFKELSLLKDVDLEHDIFPADALLEAEVLRRVVHHPDEVPVFDLEL